KSASAIPEAMPAPRATATSAPRALNFLTVSGVAATRGSLASVSRATAIRIRASPTPAAHCSGRNPGKGEDQEADDEGHHARGLGAGQEAGDQADNGDDEDRQRREPVAHHATDRQAEQQI